MLQLPLPGSSFGNTSRESSFAPKLNAYRLWTKDKEKNERAIASPSTPPRGEEEFALCSSGSEGSQLDLSPLLLMVPSTSLFPVPMTPPLAQETTMLPTSLTLTVRVPVTDKPD